MNRHDATAKGKEYREATQLWIWSTATRSKPCYYLDIVVSRGHHIVP